MTDQPPSDPDNRSSRRKDANGLTVKQEAFIQKYVTNGGNGTEAAIHAGYNRKGAAGQASDTLKVPAVQVRMETLARAFMSECVPIALGALAKLAVSAASETVRERASSSILDRTGYKIPINIVVTDTRTQKDVDRELGILLGLDVASEEGEDPQGAGTAGSDTVAHLH